MVGILDASTSINKSHTMVLQGKPVSACTGFFGLIYFKAEETVIAVM